MDRRKRKSRQAILTACIELANEKDFQQVSIQEIVERADLNRGTFYLHFIDKIDMLASFEQEMLDKIEEVLMRNMPEDISIETFIESRYATIVQILHCYEDNKELLRFILHAGNSASFQAQLGKKIKVILEEILFNKLAVINKNIPMDLVSMLFTSISLTLAQYAYHSEEPLNIDAHAKFIINIMIHGPMKTLGLASDLQIELK